MPYSECDSPFTLTNYTLDYLDKQWSSEIDFVIWTGDSARHDNDRKLPRTTKEIYELNRAVAKKMEQVFTSKGIPVIPSIGNNDVWPHNIMMPGPNEVTFEFSNIWRNFVPFPSYQVFQRGGYYSVDVIPDSVAAISLNTMYFYDSNKAVGGCEPTDPEDPGNLQLDWLEVQLSMFRSRGMQVWISGHVPPSARNYFPDCHVRYTELSLRFQDTILGHLFGHMNADHFFFLDAEDTVEGEAEANPDRSTISQAFLSSSSPLPSPANPSVVSSAPDSHTNLPDLSFPPPNANPPNAVDTLKRKKDLYGTLLRNFTHMRKIPESKLDHGNYAVVNVAPSVVPNPYLPSFRIFAYNISGRAYLPEGCGLGRCNGYGDGDGEDWEGDDRRGLRWEDGDRGGVDGESSLRDVSLKREKEEEGEEEGEEEEDGSGCGCCGDWRRRRNGRYPQNTSSESESPLTPRIQPADRRITVQEDDNGTSECYCTRTRKRMKTWNSSPNSPSRMNTLWSPLGYAQFYMPDLNGTKKHPPKYKLEYMTFKPANLHPALPLPGSNLTEDIDEVAKKFWYPIPLQHLPRSLRNGTTVREKKKSKFAPYKMEDLTIPEWLKLARKLGKAKNEKLRRKFREYMYMGGDEG